MNLINRVDIKNLIDKEKGYHVSIFLPTYMAGTEITQNPVRFKNLIRDAGRRLVNNGLSAAEADEFLEPAQKLLEDDILWHQQAYGLAVFISSKKFHYYNVPYKLKELVSVKNHFYLKPLIYLFRGDGRFYVLALSQHEARLFQGSHYCVHEVKVDNMPKGINEILKYEHHERQLQFHTKTVRSTGRRESMFHGHGEGTDDLKNKILQYFIMINHSIHNVLKEEQAPLILAGVNYLHPIYREVNTYPNLLAKGIAGNPEDIRAAKLHDMAWEIVQPVFDQVQGQAIQYYKNLSNTNAKRVLNDVKTIIPAAYNGKVELLLIAAEQQKLGSFDPSTYKVLLHQEEGLDSEDLLDFAAIHTLVHGGTIYPVEIGKMPDGLLSAAVLRY